MIGVFLKLRNYLIGMHHNGCAPCRRINLSHHFSVPPQIHRQSANAGMTAVIFPLSHCGGASSPRRCTVSEIWSRSAGANHPCMAHNAHTHTETDAHIPHKGPKRFKAMLSGWSASSQGGHNAARAISPNMETDWRRVRIYGPQVSSYRPRLFLTQD